ncbi:hypothetical protein [Streptomyces tricolor]
MSLARRTDIDVVHAGDCWATGESGRAVWRNAPPGLRLLVCHGWAGTLHTVQCMAADSGDAELRSGAE